MAMYMLFIMMVYLTDVWKLGFTYAAAIINVFWGLSRSLPLLLKFIVDTVSGNGWMLLISSIAYSVGMGFLAMSTPPVLANATGACSEYKPECIGQGQKILFYTALTLICLGLSGHLTSFDSFGPEQIGLEMDRVYGRIDIYDGDNTFFSFCRGMGQFLAIYFVNITMFAAFIVVLFINPWSIRFGIPAICTVVASLIFLTGVRSYNYGTPKGIPITTVFRVFVASATKLFYKSPKDSKNLYENRDNQQNLVPHTKTLRWLDKAAIIISTQPLEEQRKNRWRICTVTEVEETKTVIRMIPLSMTLIMCGVVTSIGLTYFVEQANHLNPKFIFFNVPLPIFLSVFQLAQGVGCSIYPFALSMSRCFSRSGSGKQAPSFGMGISMIIAIICCITAAKVEERRLSVVQKHGLVDKPDERVPMPMFWMLPQFFLLGMFYGLLDRSKCIFFTNQYPVFTSFFDFMRYFDSPPNENSTSTTSSYLPDVVSSLLGLGILGSVVSVYVVGKVSERGGKMNWFQKHLNGSRLDKYYWTLAWLMGVNLAVFIILAIFYRYKESETEDEGGGLEVEMEEPYNGEDPACCSCFGFNICMYG